MGLPCGGRSPWCPALGLVQPHHR
ncbi:hypothetical protein E2C01_073523 [Portunus trituberculatus]|uniref:Uncharacterized protein n=1 Tax=Portunus trituberculatus TaxID=210409 RepID=A0A5B7I5K4_PORTR|nr:hypothetical protein [Portunus trituberculatus]